MRFAHSVSDSFIEDYASRMAEFGSVVYGYIADGRVRAAAELRRLGDCLGRGGGSGLLRREGLPGPGHRLAI